MRISQVLLLLLVLDFTSVLANDYSCSSNLDCSSPYPVCVQSLWENKLCCPQGYCALNSHQEPYQSCTKYDSWKDDILYYCGNGVWDSYNCPCNAPGYSCKTNLWNAVQYCCPSNKCAFTYYDPSSSGCVDAGTTKWDINNNLYYCTNDGQWDDWQCPCGLGLSCESALYGGGQRCCLEEECAYTANGDNYDCKSRGFIALVSGSKYYCNSGWHTSKSDGESCSNNYECEAEVCINGVCGNSCSCSSESDCPDQLNNDERWDPDSQDCNERKHQVQAGFDDYNCNCECYDTGVDVWVDYYYACHKGFCGASCESESDCDSPPPLSCDLDSRTYTFFDAGTCTSSCECNYEPHVDSGSLYCDNCNHCGDGVINCGESCSNCPIDAGDCPPVCGDGVCEGDENSQNCLQDCPLSQVVTSVSLLDTDIPNADRRYLLNDGTSENIVQVTSEGYDIIDDYNDLIFTKLISTSDLGDKRVFTRVRVVGTQAQVYVNDYSFTHPSTVPDGVRNTIIGLWSEWIDITDYLDSDLSEFKIKLGVGHETNFDLRALKVEFRVIDPDEDFVILASPVILSSYSGLFDAFVNQCDPERSPCYNTMACMELSQSLDVFNNMDPNFELIPLNKVHNGEFNSLVEEEIKLPLNQLLDSIFPGEDLSKNIKVLPLSSICNIETDFVHKAALADSTCSPGTGPCVYESDYMTQFDLERFHFALRECLGNRFDSILPGKFYGGRIVGVDITPDIHPVFVQTPQARYETGWNIPWSPVIYTKAEYTQDTGPFTSKEIHLTENFNYNLAISLGLNPETSCDTCTKDVCIGEFGPDVEKPELSDVLNLVNKTIIEIAKHHPAAIPFDPENQTISTEIFSIELYKRMKVYGCSNHNNCDFICPDCEKTCLGACGTSYLMDAQTNILPTSEIAYLKNLFGCEFNIAGKRDLEACNLLYDGPLDRDVIELIRQKGMLLQLETVKAYSYLQNHGVDFHDLDNLSDTNIGEVRTIAENVCMNYGYAFSDMKQDCCDTCPANECAFDEIIYLPNSEETVSSGEVAMQISNLCMAREVLVDNVGDEVLDYIRLKPYVNFVVGLFQFSNELYELTHFYHTSILSLDEMDEIQVVSFSCDYDHVCEHDQSESAYTCSDCAGEIPDMVCNFYTSGDGVCDPDCEAVMDSDCEDFIYGQMIQGESHSNEIVVPEGGWKIVMGYPGSDLDLHLYNTQGEHVGYNYTSGELDLLPGTEYSGNDVNPEWITLNSEDQANWTVEVVAIETEGTEPYQVFLTDTSNDTGASTDVSVGVDSVLAMSVTQFEINFGKLRPGEIKQILNATQIVNEGNIPLKIRAEATSLEDSSGKKIPVENLLIRTDYSGQYTPIVNDIVIEDNLDWETNYVLPVDFRLDLPEKIAPGNYTAVVSFIASGGE